MQETLEGDREGFALDFTSTSAQCPALAISLIWHHPHQGHPNQGPGFFLPVPFTIPYGRQQVLSAAAPGLTWEVLQQQFWCSSFYFTADRLAQSCFSAYLHLRHAPS